MTTAIEATSIRGIDADALRAQVDRHHQLGVTRHCAACNALWPCAYRTAARNKLRAAGVHVAGLL